MPFLRSLNHQTIAGGNAFVWFLKELLKTAGWTVPLCGTGTGGSYSSSGDLFTSHATGDACPKPTNTVLGGPLCWLVLEAPNGRQIIFWRRDYSNSNGDSQWFIGYSHGGLYTGGSANSAATAADEKILYNQRPPAGFDLFRYGNNVSIVHMMCNSTAVNGEYAFYAIEVIPTNAIGAFVFWDTLSNIATGDGHPLVVGVIDGAPDVTILGQEAGTRTIVTLKDAGGGGEAIVNAGYGYSRAFNAGHATNAQVSLYDLKERPFPYSVYGASGAGYIGVSTGLQQVAVNRGYPATDDTKYHLYAGGSMLINFWDGSSVPLTV